MASILISNGIEPEQSVPLQMSYGLPTSRDHVVIDRKSTKRPFDGGVSTVHTHNEIVTVTIPASDALLDPSTVFFSANLHFSDPNTAEIRDSVRKLFKKIKIVSHATGQTLEEIDDVNLLERYILMCKYGNEYASRVLQSEGFFDSRYQADALLGASDEKYRWSKQIDNTAFGDTSTVNQAANIAKYARLTDPTQAAGALQNDGKAAANHVRTIYGDFCAAAVDAARRRVVWRFDSSGFLGQLKYVPLKYVGGLRFELTFAPQNQTTYSTAGTGTQSMSNMHVHYDLVQLAPEALDVLHSEHQQGQMRLMYDTFGMIGQPATGQNFSLQINKSVAQVKDVLVTLHAANPAGVDGKSDVFESTGGNFTSAQLKWNNLRYPVDPIDNYVIAYEHFLHNLKATPGLGTSDVPSLAEYEASKFMLLWNLETLPYEDSWTAVSSKGQKVIDIDITTSANRIPRVFYRYTRIVELNPDDSIAVAE